MLYVIVNDFFSYTIYVHVFTVMLTGFGELAVISGSPGLSVSSKTLLQLNAIYMKKNSLGFLHAGCRGARRFKFTLNIICMEIKVKHMLIFVFFFVFSIHLVVITDEILRTFNFFPNFIV